MSRCGTPGGISQTEGVSAYQSGFAAIESLFGGLSAERGDITLRSRDIRTKQGGDISVFAPSGKLSLANTALNTLIPPGIVTESGGNIGIFTRGDVSLGIGRIFTLRGGNQIIWSSEGDIAAGSSAKTVTFAPPTRVILDPQSADVQTDLAGLATGGGIGVLATVAGVKPGEVDLIAPNGAVDAGMRAFAPPVRFPLRPWRCAMPITSPLRRQRVCLLPDRRRPLRHRHRLRRIQPQPIMPPRQMLPIRPASKARILPRRHPSSASTYWDMAEVRETMTKTPLGETTQPHCDEAEALAMKRSRDRRYEGAKWF